MLVAACRFCGKKIERDEEIIPAGHVLNKMGRSHTWVCMECQTEIATICARPAA